MIFAERENAVVSPVRPYPTPAARLLTDYGWLWPLGLYALLSLLLFGVPLLAHSGSRIIAVNDLDPSFLIWMLAWWPHAVLHGLNPFVTHAILYPDGYNLTWSTSMPLPSIALAPITLGFGPAVSWNVLELLCPALSAWTAFLLCRHIVGRMTPSLIGGYVFGFSPYMLAHLQASPNLALVALVPVFVLVVLRRIDHSTSRRRFVIEMTLAVTAQCLIETEVLATSTLFGVIALLLAYGLFPARRAALLDVAKLLVASYAAAAVLLSPFLYYFLFGRHYPPGDTFFPADLVSFVVPPTGLALTRHGPSLAGSDLETYLGLPLVLLAAIFCWQRRRARTTLLLVLCAAVTGVAALGGRLVVRGHVTSIWLPWRLTSNLPLRYAIPSRFVLFVTLAAAVIVAMWLRESGSGGARRPWFRMARWGLALLVVASFVPAVGSAAWDTRISDPPFFQHGAYRSYLNSSDHVLTIPFWGPSQRWVADAGFPFALTAGSAGRGNSPSYTRYPIWRTLVAYPYPLRADYAAELRQFLIAKDVTAIVVEQGFPGPWRKLFGTLGIRPVTTGGVLVYRLDRRLGSGT